VCPWRAQHCRELRQRTSAQDTTGLAGLQRVGLRGRDTSEWHWFADDAQEGVGIEGVDTARQASLGHRAVHADEAGQSRECVEQRGDVAVSDQQCACGRAMPILEKIEGRFEDMCITRDGRELLRFDTVFKGVEGIKEAQVVQERVDLFRILVVPAPGFGEHDVLKLRANMRIHVGDTVVEVEPVDAIERTRAGKFRAVVCRIPAAEKQAIRTQAAKQ